MTADEVLSLPLYEDLKLKDQKRVIDFLIAINGGNL